ncbi:MAG: hypothetical protein MUC50_22750, partial [Myxococcota bacterium]|nr:hypothetical protein [Myxococcota bacterium]
CLGKSSCTVSASNGVFGDPCSGTAKKLAVVYACGGGVVDNCPSDPNKTEPGQCGCGVPEGTCAVVAYYHLRVELSSSSDWAKVVIAKPEHVLRVGTPRITGGGNRVRANLDLIEVNRPSGTVTISADYAVKPVAIKEGLQNFFGLLTKGSSGQTTFSVRRIDGACSNLASCPGGVEIGRASAGQGVGQATIQFQSDQGQNVAPKSAEMLPSPPLAWAVYYPWYRDRDPFASNTLEQSIANRGDLRNRVNSYWTNNTSFKDRPVGPSDMGGMGMLSYDPVALRTQVEQAVGAGIDGFLPYYRGTTHFTHGATGLLLDAVSEVNAAQGVGFRVGLHLSPQGAQENAGSGDPVDLLAAWATDFVRKYGNHPAVMKIYSKPLAIVYSTGLFEPGDWKRFRERCAGNGVQLFLVADNASATDFGEYIVHFDGAIGRSIDAARGREIGTQLRHNAIFTSERPKLWLGEARPGFDSSNRGEPKDSKYEPRDNGATFQERFDEAEAIHPQWIRIVSWNEYYEHTHIEPSRDYASQYLNIVRDRVGSWKKAATFAGASLP